MLDRIYCRFMLSFTHRQYLFCTLFRFTAARRNAYASHHNALCQGNGAVCAGAGAKTASRRHYRFYRRTRSGQNRFRTFSLVHEYDGPVTLYHFDMYRIHSLDELYSTGFFDYLDCGGIMAIEWSENIAAVLEQERCIAVSIEPDDENIRIITVNGGDRF